MRRCSSGAATHDAAAAAAEASAAASRVTRSLTPEQRRAMDEAIRTAFQEAQRSRRTRQVRHLTLGQGLGSAAETTLQDGSYAPRSVFAHTTSSSGSGSSDDNSSVNVTSTRAAHDTNNSNDNNDNDASPPPPLPLHDDDASSLAFLQRVRSISASAGVSTASTADTATATTMTMRAVRDAVQSNVTAATDALDALCAPYAFASVVDALDAALAAVDRGSARARVVLPLRRRHATAQRHEQHEHDHNDDDNNDDDDDDNTTSADVDAVATATAAAAATTTGDDDDAMVCLTGAQAVMTYARETLLPLCFRVVPTTHAVQWVMQYTMTYLRAQCARDDDDAAQRLQLLAQCARLHGLTQQFAALLLALDAKSTEYAAVDTLQRTATTHLGALLDRVEATLCDVLALPFPLRRARLQRVEPALRATLQRVVQLLSELEYSWSPTVRAHAAWQRAFLRAQYTRIHTALAPRYVACTLGFIDEVLYRPVRDARITGRGSKHCLLPHTPTVPVALQVQYNRVVERLSFAQIAMEVKGLASVIAGHQLCMGARYVLRESARTHNDAWGFDMDELMDVATSAEVAAKVAQWVGSVRARARRAATPTPRTNGQHDDDNSNNDNNDDHDHDDDNDDASATLPDARATTTPSPGTTFLTQGAALERDDDDDTVA